MRRSFAVLFLMSLLQAAACGDPKKLTCDSSIASACAIPGRCVLIWEQAQDDASFCSDAALASPRRADCGAYHVLTTSYVDASLTYYYEAATGMLVAIVQAGFGGTACAAGPEGGFTPPTCTGEVSEPLSQCLDGGTDASID